MMASEHKPVVLVEPELMSHEELQDRIGDLIHGFEWPAIRMPRACEWLLEEAANGAGSFDPWTIDLADDRYLVEIRKAQEKLGWEPRRHLRDTLEEMIRRLRRDPAGWCAENGLNLPPEKAMPQEAVTE